MSGVIDTIYILEMSLSNQNHRQKFQNNFMEDQVVQLAKRRNFMVIFTTNTSPLTQQLGPTVYNYQVLLDYQVNKYVGPDSTKPFWLAPDFQRAIVHCKPL